LQGIYELGYE
jgi:ATP-dependent RNA helicase DDX6/DHH1